MTYIKRDVEMTQKKNSDVLIKLLFSHLTFVITLFLQSSFISLLLAYPAFARSSMTDRPIIAVATNIDKEKKNVNNEKKCMDHKTCEMCEKIYDADNDKIACQKESLNKVNRLSKIYDLLKDGDYEGWDKFFLDEDEENLKYLKDYLNIGDSGIENLIKNHWSEDQLIKFLQLIIDKIQVAEILYNLARGKYLLEKILLAIRNKTDQCIGHNTLNDCDDSPHGHYGRTGYGVDYSSDDDTVNICTEDKNPSWSYTLDHLFPFPKEFIWKKRSFTFLDDDNTSLYDALSCFSLIDKSSSLIAHYNVFSYASIKDNDFIFNMAYDLLNDTCENFDTDENHYEQLCKKVSFCWIHEVNEKQGEKSFRYLDELGYDDDLEGDSGGSNYNQCEPRHFAEFF